MTTTLTEFIPGGKVKAQEINGNFTTLKNAIEDESVTKQGNTFNGASQLVKTNSNGQLPAIDGSLLMGIYNGLLPISNLGDKTSDFILNLNNINLADISAPLNILLPSSGFIEGIENVVVLDFTTISTAYPTISTSGTLKWSDKNSGQAPNSYSILSGVKNRLVFKTIDGGITWEAEYSTYGAVELAFIRPNLSANGTLGGDSFAVAASTEATTTTAAWYAVNGNISTSTSVYWWYGTGNLLDWYKIYNPSPIKVSKFTVTNFNSATSHAITGGNVYASNDDVVYTFLTSFTNSIVSALGVWDINIPEEYRSYYKYYKIAITGVSSTNAIINELDITGTYFSV